MRAGAGACASLGWVGGAGLREGGQGRTAGPRGSSPNLAWSWPAQVQVLDWMKNPVPASQYSPKCPSEKELMALLPQGTALCVMPNEGCAYVSPCLAAACPGLGWGPPGQVHAPADGSAGAGRGSMLAAVHLPLLSLIRASAGHL